MDAAAAGADLDDLKILAQAAYEAWRAQEPDPEEDPAGRGFGDRCLRLETTLDGAGRIGGDLTPECAAAVTAVLEALGKSRGPEDFRTAGQRYHDALQEGCELLIRAKMVPDRAGADTRVDVTIPLSDLLAMDGASVIEDTWLRARAGEHGYLSGKDAEAIACDALIVPLVTGSPDWALIGQMITLVADAYAHAADARHGLPAPPGQPARPAAGRSRSRSRRCRCRPSSGRTCSTPSPASRSSSSPAPAPSPPRCAAASSAPPSTARASSSTSATPTPSPNRSARPSSPATRAAPGPAAATAAPPPATSTTSSTKGTAGRPASETASCSASFIMTSASTGWAGKSNSCPTDPPAPPAPTDRPSCAATDHHRHTQPSG